MDFLIQLLGYIFPASYQVNEGDVIGVTLLLAMLLIFGIFIIMLRKGQEKESKKTIDTRSQEVLKTSIKESVVTDVFKESKVEKTVELESGKEEILEEEGEKVIEAVEASPVPPQPPQKSWKERLFGGLSRSREQIFNKIGSILSGKKIGKEELEMVEELLYSADLGPKIVNDLIAQLEQDLPKKEMGFEELKKFLFDYMHNKLEPVQSKLSIDFSQGHPQKNPTTIMIVGVNGAGKTTTIGKLATQFAKSGNKVYVGACDTFRAAAVDQLQIWCDRAKVSMIRAKEGADPSGVAYEALQKSINDKADYCLLDTAGRLHTKANLMEELKKSKRVLSKLDEDAPDHVFLVLDAVTGQNALRQAQEFHKTLGITALIFTKCDGSSKAGSAVGIMDELQVPIAYIGVGESVDDLRPFELTDYLEALLDYQAKK